MPVPLGSGDSTATWSVLSSYMPTEPYSLARCNTTAKCCALFDGHVWFPLVANSRRPTRDAHRLPRVVCGVSVFEEGQSFTENSFNGAQRSWIVENTRRA